MRPSSPAPPCRAMKQASNVRQGMSVSSTSAGSKSTGRWLASRRASSTAAPLARLTSRSGESPPASTATRNGSVLCRSIAILLDGTSANYSAKPDFLIRRSPSPYSVFLIPYSLPLPHLNLFLQLHPQPLRDLVLHQRDQFQHILGLGARMR